MKKRILSLLLALVMVFSIMPSNAIIALTSDRTIISVEEMIVGETYSAEWDYSEYDDVILHREADGEKEKYETLLQKADLPQELKVQMVKEGDSYLYIANEDWPSELNEYRFVEYYEVIVYVEKTPEKEIGASIGNFNVSVSGDVPEDATLNLGAIAEEDLDQGILDRRDVNMKSFIGAFDISISRNGSEWQPESGKPVTVTMNAAALGLYTGQSVYIIHMHEDSEGDKSYEIMGPIFVGNGKFSFETDKFSDFAVYQGTGAVVLSENSTLYLEPGTTVAVAIKGNYGTTAYNAVYISGEDTTNIKKGTVNSNAVCNSGNGTTMTVEVGNNATVGETTTYTVSRGSSTYYSRYELNIVVGTRAKVTEIALQNYPLVIGIRKPAADGTFPSEPVKVDYSAGEYFFLQNGNNNTDQADDSVVTTTTNYYTSASTFLDPTVMGNSFGWMYDASGNAIGGVIDATGYYTKACFKDGTVDWHEIAQVIANHNDKVLTDAGLTPATVTAAEIKAKAEDENDTDLDNIIFVRYQQEDDSSATGFTNYAIILTNQESKTIDSYGDAGVSSYSLVHYNQFELIPYVVKLAAATIESSGWFNTSSDSVWHVDIALVRGDSYTISYDLNLGSDIITETAVALPQSKVFVEDPSDSDTLLTYTFKEGDLPTATTLTVYHIDNKSAKGTATFLGWYTSNTCSDVNDLYGPNAVNEENRSITIGADTKLYAIWTVENISITKTTFSVDKQVTLLPGSPLGSKTPIPGGTDFIRFNFSIDIPYDGTDDTSQYGEIYFEVYRWKADYSALESITLREDDGSSIDVITLAEMYADSSKIPSYFTITAGTGKTTLTFNLADGEYVKFLNVPFSKNASENTFKITETIPSDATRYTASNPELSITLNETTDARATFINQYDAPTAGLQINVGGDDGEFFIFEVLQHQKADGDDHTNDVQYSTIVVPANDTAVIAGLANNEDVEYIVREKTTGDKWSWRWNGWKDKNGNSITQITAPEFDSSGTAVVEFVPVSSITQWLFGNGRSFTTDTVTIPTN